jgi:large subunit ribosomal protein L14e
VVITYGPDLGKLATIVDSVDGKRVLIDGPQNITGVHRQVIGTKRIQLTGIVASGLSRNATQKSLKAAWEEQNVLGKWKETSWAKKLDAKSKRANTSDFDRFKVRVAKKERASIIAKL